jgi:sentrin-specific protease 8
MEDNKIFLSYKSICLYKDDVECFNNYNQLNDMCISFYYAYLTYTLSLPDNIVLMDPSAVSSIIYFDDDLSELKDYFMDLSDKEYIFLPVNDNTDKLRAGGGSHWALLVYQKFDNKFYYFDSMLGYIKNTDVLAERVGLMIGVKDIEIVKPAIKKYQQNTYDCGMFVLLFTELILKYLKNERNIGASINYEKDVFKDLTQDKILQWRIIISKKIDNLRNKLK